MKFLRHTFRSLVAARIMLPLLAACSAAQATNHALIMAVGEYAQPKHNLPGIDKDIVRARRMAVAMGVPAGNIRELYNRGVTRQAMAQELDNLSSRIQQSDKIFIYFSGHGYQEPGRAGAICTESLVTHEQAQYFDVELQAALERLSNRASQVVMMNDSCFSGGSATKGLVPRSPGGAVAKFFPGELKGGTSINRGYQCGQAVNKMARNLEVIQGRPEGPRVLYIAASRDTELAFATPEGSVATMAWTHCLESAAADTDRSGAINGQELQSCAQRYINERAQFAQTIELRGDTNLPLSFATSSGRPNAQVVDAVNALRDLQAVANKNFQVVLTPTRSELRIRQDFLDFTVTTTRAGYLYLLQVGSDGKTFNVLFPNQLDMNNRVSEGTHSFPRAKWRIRAGGPEGTSHILAVVSPTKKELTKDMDWRGVFATAGATATSLKTLIVEATGADGGSGELGVSGLIAITEMP